MVTVDWLEGRSSLQKAQLADVLTKAFVEIAHVAPQQVWIVFRDVPKADWAMGGHLLDGPSS
jgi:4-oxalocrotonate tautomerase